MDNNYMKTILSGVKEWTENLTDDAIDKANKSIDKALFVVNITRNSDLTLSADKTFDEIVQVYNEDKYNIVANVAALEFPVIAYLVAISEHGILFSNSLASGKNDAGLIIIGIASNNEVQIEILPLATKTSKLPNPYPLTFTGAVEGSYDGSEPLTVEIPIGAAGKSAYQYAVEGGYTDTEANFYADLAAMQGLASALAAI